MPIIDIQRRLTQVGVIRLGHKVPTGNTNRRGEPTYRPAKLDQFRITSPDRGLIEAVAERYRGEVKPWQGTSGPEWEVFTEARELPVLVPPQRIDPNYELWGNGFQARLCDGQTERKRNCPCLCLKGDDGHVHDFQFAEGFCECGATRECKPTTRLSLMLAEIPGLGVWKLESHGRNAAAELPMTSDALENAPGPVPARLLIVKVEKKRLANAGKKTEKIEPRSFFVPKLVFDWVTPRQAFSGQIGAAARTALTGGPEQRQAIGSAPAEQKAEQPAEGKTAAQVLALVKLARNLQQLNGLSADAKSVDPNDPGLPALQAEWKRRAEMFREADAARESATEHPPVDVIVDAELVDEPDAGALWNEVVAASPWPSTSELERQFKAHQGVAMVDANGHQLAAFLTAIKSGQVS